MSQLFGYAIFDDAVVYGTSGLTGYYAVRPEIPLPFDGRFAGIFVSGDELVIRSDRTGQEMLFLFKDGADWAISSSFMLLAAETAQKHRLTLYEPAVVGFHLKDGVHIGEQLISHRTMVKEIDIVPLTSDIIVDRRTGDLRVLDRGFEQSYSMGGLSYNEKLLDFLERSAGIQAALSEIGTSMQMLLSGGYDSRLALGLLLAGGRPESLRVTSHPHKIDDFRIANSICDDLNIPLNTPSPKRRNLISAGESFRMWMLSCGGTYLPIYPVRNTNLLANAELRITGDQPTGWSHFAGNAPFNGNAKKISRDIGAALKKRPFAREVLTDFHSVFDRHGIDPSHPKAMLAHYCAVRSRHHCGRSWYKSLGHQQLFTPLMLGDMTAIGLHDSGVPNSDIRFFADAFSALGGWVLEHAFETPERSLPTEMLEESPFKGGVKITPRKMSVFGFGQQTAAAGPDLMSVQLNMSFKEQSFKEHLASGLWSAEHTKQNKLFNAQDFIAANAEIAADGSLSHDFRKTSHIVTAETVMGIVDGSHRPIKPNTPATTAPLTSSVSARLRTRNSSHPGKTR